MNDIMKKVKDGIRKYNANDVTEDLWNIPTTGMNVGNDVYGAGFLPRVKYLGSEENFGTIDGLSKLKISEIGKIGEELNADIVIQNEDGSVYLYRKGTTNSVEKY